MDAMRYTIVDSEGAVSFVGPGHMLSSLVAACSESPPSLDALLGIAERYDRRLPAYVLNGLAIFDEHNVAGHYEVIREQLRTLPPEKAGVFRVVDDTTREASLRKVKEGVVLFNLIKKRIVQIQNTYEEVERSGEVHVHNGHFLTKRVYRYSLPESWSIVP